MEFHRPKISVVIISYNQESLINRAIDSVLMQKEYLHELIISDDCSTDNTWSVIRTYQREHPFKVKGFRHERNLGIYGNYYSTCVKTTGDIVFTLSGDDELGEGLLKYTCQILEKEELDYENECFCVLSNYLVVLPNGERKVKSNALVAKYPALQLKLRDLIANRALGQSSALWRKNTQVDSDNRFGASNLQEGLADNFPYSMAKKVFYLNCIGNIYYSRIGVSTSITKRQRLVSQIEYCDEIPKYIINLSRYDIRWLRFQRVEAKFLLHFSLLNTLDYYRRFIMLVTDPLFPFLIFREGKNLIKNTLQYFFLRRPL